MASLIESLFDISQFRSLPKTEYSPLSFADAWSPTPYHKNVELVGYGGLGIYLPNLALLWPVVMFAAAFYALRLAFKRIRVAKHLGISHRNSEKLMYQVWLMTYYVLSSIYGLSIMYGKPWCAFPLGPSQKLHQLLNYPQMDAQVELQYYYCCAIGFYVAELIAIFSEFKRSDFRQYLIHHSLTLYLLVFSWLGFQHIPGAYVILLHDLSDVFLCVSKTSHYMRLRSVVTNTAFGLFVVGFVFFRLYCQPHQTTMLFTLLPTIQSANVNFWFMIAFSQILQGLHFFWGFLILRMIIRLCSGVEGDVRSDDDDVENQTNM